MSINKEEKLIDQQNPEIKETTKQADTQSVDAWKAETEVNQSLSQVDQSVVLKKTKDEAHSLEQDSKWEFKNLSDPQEFQKAISILTVFYQEILKDTWWRKRNNPFDSLAYSADAKMSLKNTKAKAKERVKILKNMQAQFKNEMHGTVPLTFVEELTKMLRDTSAFREAIAKAALGQRADHQISSADYSEKGMKKTQEKQEEQLAYLDKIQNLSLKNAIQKLEIDDKSALIKYLNDVQKGNIAHPAMDQYFQQHKADILYLCCLDVSLNKRILGHYQIKNIARSDIGEKNWKMLSYNDQQLFFGDPQTMRSFAEAPQRPWGLRGLLRDLMGKITPQMQPAQREMWMQLAETSLAVVAIWKFGKWLFKKNEKWEGAFWKKAGILLGVGAGAEFLGQGLLGKGLGATVNGILNGGKDWEELKARFWANTEYVEQSITKPMQAVYLFNGLNVQEAEDLITKTPKDQLYAFLHKKYSEASPKNEQALVLLEKMNKADPSQELNQYLLALIPTGKLAADYKKMKIEDLAEIRAGNMKALDFYLKNHPDLELNPDKQDELLEKMKSDQNFLEKDLDQLVKEGFFIRNEQYTTAFESQVKQLSLSLTEEQNLRKELHLLENNPDLKHLEFKALNTEEVQLSLNGQSIRLNVKAKILEGFKNSAGTEIRFADHAELLRTGALIAKTGAAIKDKAVYRPWGDRGLRTKFTDWMMGSSPEQENWPFYISTTGSISFNGVGQPVVVDDLSPFPFFTEMNTKYPTINTHKQYFVNYLNTHQKLRLNAK